MRRMGLWVALLLGLATFGCGPMAEVSQVYDDVDFAKYKTYDWIPRSEGGAAVPEGRQKYLEDALTKNIEQQMAAKGFVKVSENPDALVGYWYGLADRETGSVDFEVDYTQYYANSEVWKSGGGGIRVDLVDPKTRRIVWCGMASGAANVDPSEEIVQRNIDRMVKKIFAQYPPRKPAQ